MAAAAHKIIRARPHTGLQPQGLLHLPELLRRIYATRQVVSAESLDRSLARLPEPGLLTGMAQAVGCLAAAIARQAHFLVVADFDADGATACAVAVRGLRLLGARRVSFIVPNRFKHNYGLTPELVEAAAPLQPEVLITVDNGIASVDGVRDAQARGWQVVVTDHHLPGTVLPAAEAIVDPNLPDDRFPSKCLAGVGVIFYVLIALRAALRDAGHWPDGAAPNLGQLLDLVALGTVADVVPLDHVNRILVHQGLQRIHAGRAQPGVIGLIEAAKRNAAQLSSTDLGFALGPRLNAAGRMEDMSIGIACLLADDLDTARTLALKLDALNGERREVEEQMRQDAWTLLEPWADLDPASQPAGVCLYDDSWHPGVVGILASRIKDRLHRPVIAFAPGEAGEIKGSARSVPGVHIRDVLAEVAVTYPGMLTRFGGHAMAAGLSLPQACLERFTAAFDTVVQRHSAGLDPSAVVWVDGELAPSELNLALAETLRDAGPWGQGFPEPAFVGEFDVVQARPLGGRHLKLVLAHRETGMAYDAVKFFLDDPETWQAVRRIRAAYRLDINEFRGERELQLRVEHLELIE